MTSKRKSKAFCCVLNCNSKAIRDPDVSFHVFPHEKQMILRKSEFGESQKCNRRKEWIRLLRIGKKVTKYMVVCSKHFTPEDYILSSYACKRRQLKKTSVPSLLLPESSICTKTCSKRIKRNKFSETMYQTEETSHAIESEISDREQTEETSHAIDFEINDREAAETLLMLCNSNSDKNLKYHRSVGIQISTGEFLVNIRNFVKTESQLNSITGIPTFKLFNAIVKLFSDVCKTKQISNTNFSFEDKLFMVLIKMKLNISFSVISLFFHCSVPTASRIFYSGVKILASVLKCAIVWPSKINILENMPKCFNRFRNVRVILDCSEIRVQRPKCLKCQIRCYSHYKGDTTIKFLIGVSPGGIATFLSSAYGGRTSDKAIFEQSDILNLLTPYSDSVMVDKGFLIDKLCLEKGIEVIQPPFLKKNKQLNKCEAVRTKDIACARVHVERFIQRIKQFKIFSARLPWKMTSVVDELLIIATAVGNLSPPILSDDKF
ncbi:uncharacterized protein [Centruroides vittatus]|uniref:uncharacterized protein n=1 Tax=Centruroides vittatus TaxID=120091 RepID=UPI0035102191